MAGNYTVIRRFSDNYFSVTQLKHKKPEGRTEFKEHWLDDNDDISTPDQKLKESLVRSRTRIFEIAMCNDWELFATFTIDKTKYDRFNLSAYYKDFSTYINHLNTRYGLSVKYLLIPETHKNGAWHLHGLFMGIPKIYLRRFNLFEKLPKYIRKKLSRGFDVFDWPSYRSRFGFCDLELIRNKEACCKYIVKYITKDLDRSVKECHSKVYYCSQGLKRPDILYVGEDSEMIAFPDFSTVWIDRKDFFTFADALEYSNLQFYDSFINAGLDESTISRILSSVS